MHGERAVKAALVAGAVGAIAISVYNFVAALPTDLIPACCAAHPVAKDFSAYYVGLWRLLHDASQIYTNGFVNDGEIRVYPVQEQFKYMPSFLLMISPLAYLDYQQGILAFDIFQLALLPAIGFFVYRLTRSRGLLLAGCVTLIVLSLPLPAPGLGLSIAYFWQWNQGQAKVLEAFLILSAFYAGSSGSAVASGVLLGLSFFDPRFGLLAVPLFVMYNRPRLRTASLSFVASFTASNFLLFLSPGTASGFVQMVFAKGVETYLYPYALIPAIPIIALWLINRREMQATWSDIFLRFRVLVGGGG